MLLITAVCAALIADGVWYMAGKHYGKTVMSTARISVDELHQLQMAGAAPVIEDVRPALAQREGRIPGAMAISLEELDELALDMPIDSEVIVYCACPNEASAARVARQLMQKVILVCARYTGELMRGLLQGIRWNPGAR